MTEYLQLVLLVEFGLSAAVLLIAGVIHLALGLASPPSRRDANSYDDARAHHHRGIYDSQTHNRGTMHKW